jgi:DNA polymerase I
MSGQRPRLVLVDGSSYIYRAFFALPPLSGPSGLPTNAVYGFTTMLLKLLADAHADYVAVVFDAPGATFRDQLYADYKAHRPAMPGDLAAQIPWIHRVVAALRLHELTVPGVEADDVIASLIEQQRGRDLDCVIVTGDKDLMQLVGPGVRLWDTMRDRWTDAAAVEAKFGVPPERVVDVMALMGDSIDNIPGVKGIGEKTAVALIQACGDLEGVLGHLDAVAQMNLRGAKKVAERLRDDAATARLSRTLASVRRDVPLTSTLDELRVVPPDQDAARTLFNELGFESLLRQLSAEAPTLTVAAALVESAAQAEEHFARARVGGWLALAALADPGPAVSAPAREVVVATADAPPVRLRLDDPALCEVVREQLRDAPFAVIGHDLKRDLLHLGARGIGLGGRGFDVMIAAALTDPNAADTLEKLAAELLGARPAAYRDSSEGAAGGVSVLGALMTMLRTRLDELALARLFDDVEMPLVAVLANIERRGMLVDVARLRALGSEFAGRLDALMAEIYALAGSEFNINSPPQLRTVLFDQLGLSKRGVRRGKTGFSTDVDVLTRLARDHPLPAKILEYRALAKLKSTYIDALPAAVNPTTGRLHTSLNQAGAATGRLSSSEPNLQNIPVRGDEGRRIRETFIAPAGSVLIAADYSQIELRVLAHLSGDPALLDAFSRGQDVHARTAAEVFGVLPGTVSSEMRRVAKVINFGILYGMGPQRLANELGIALVEAQRYIASYFDRYAGVRRYLEVVVSEARERGYASTILGRRRPIPELRSPERGVAQAAERVATNTPIQGSAADLIKKAMVAIERRLATAGVAGGMVLQVHDELLLEVEEGARDSVCAAVREEMEGVMELAVPLRVDLGVGRTWAEAH